ncbi:MAG: DNA polymerase III subunit gamma/tau [Pseudomonadales bacterium]|nr:DNA polymerase III subunit gamma/tau [Pseudomonadales bacterium]
MSYQVLARKYRPRSFRELVGQEHVAKALVHALDQDRLHHAYLFTGTRGVGKTTIARILARCLNCETGISSEPCGVCGTCLEINEGRYVDLIEIDAASRTKVEDTRELLDNVQYAPTRGRYKVYLIDEVHMLSGHSFNALLKTLEEPPPHVKFLLATTDPQKLPVTVLSRCLQFALKPMSVERIVGHLQKVLDQEVITYEEVALQLLARSAQGSMRDALSLTDQAISFGDGGLRASDVATMLGSIDRQLVVRLLQHITQGAAAEVMAVVAQMAEQSLDFAQVLADIVSLLHQLALVQLLPERADDEPELTSLASALSGEALQLYYQIALQGRRDLPFAFDARSGVEMTLLRMLVFKPMPQKAERASTPSRPATRVPDVASISSSSRVVVDLPVPDQVRQVPVCTASVPSSLPPGPVVEAPSLPVANSDFLGGQAWWDALQAMEDLQGMARSLAMNAVPRQVSGKLWELYTQMPASMADMGLEPLQQSFRRWQGQQDLQLQLVYQAPVGMTPMELQAERQKQEQATLMESFHQDPTIAGVIERFGAEITAIESRH